MPLQNELILIVSIFVFFGGLVTFFRFLGKQGIFAWTVVCTIAANIEVLILILGYAIFIVTSLMDTPFIYLARRIAEKHPDLLKN